MPKHRCTCGARYRFDASAVGRKARCKKCGEVFTLTPDPADTGDGVIPIAADDPFAAEIAAAAQRAKTASASPPRAEGSAPGPPVALADLPVDRISPPLVDEPKPSRGYWGSVSWSLLFPTTLNNLIVFMIMWGLLCLSELVLGYAGCLGLVGQLVIIGWYCAFRFETIALAAAGEDDLPGVTLSEGVVDGIVLPLFRWLGSWLLVLLPVFAYLIVLGVSSKSRPDLLGQVLGGVGGMLQTSSTEVLLMTLLLVLALFSWPIVALCVAIGGFGGLYRIDLLFATVFRTLPVYLFTAAVVIGSGYVPALIDALTGGTAAGLSLSFGASLIIGGALYCDLVAMRVIGLYYHHFKHRFAWDWG